MTFHPPSPRAARALGAALCAASAAVALSGAVSTAPALAADTTAPTVKWRAPLAGATLEGALPVASCEALASDPSGIARVVFAVDGTTLNTEVNAPYNCVFDPTKVSDGSHALRATAYDRAGNAHTASITVRVANGVPSTAPAPAPTAPAPTAPAPTAAPLGVRSIPVSPAGYLGNFNLSSRLYVQGSRFVLDRTTTVDRWYFAINGEGARCVPGRTGYGAGDGGTHHGRIVEVDQVTGLPTNRVLATETVGACTAFNRAKAEFGLSSTHQAHFVQFSPVTLQAGRMYAFLLSNVHASPGTGGGASTGNHMSTNNNFAKLTELGPNGRNTLDPRAPGATSGLDPRETTLWSADGGASWRFGDRVGWYGLGDGTGRTWPGGYRVAGGANVGHGWPYMNWPGEGAASITFRNAPRDLVLTRAGGASSTGAVGVVTVTNTTTGASATTSALGTGLVASALSRPISVAAGQSYTVRTAGRVDTATPDGFWNRIFGLGSRAPQEYTSSCSACSSPGSRPMLYAAP